MRFAAGITVDLPSDVVGRSPTFWDKCRALVGAKVDLSTNRVRSRVEAATFLHQVRSAMDALGIDNARFLIVDGVAVFEDDKGRPNDLPDLMVAFADHLLVLTESCRRLSLSVEHEEAGLSIELEARFALEHGADEPATLVSILGRIHDLAPRPLESTDAYRARIEGFLSDPAHTAALRFQFATFVSRVEQALKAALPGATLETNLRALETDDVVAVQGGGAPARDERFGNEGPFQESRDAPVVETASPPRNFTVSLEQRIASAVTGPPSFALRLRKIEDLRDELIGSLAVSERESLDAVPACVELGLEELNRLIRDHNRFYPVERNLPMDPSTGKLLVGGEPWRPLPPVTVDELRRITAAMRGAAAAARRGTAR
ncbi:MAG TPA: hypothetical protein VEK07_09890 [Polyangiaceae bacterium]|nr:hypothetical protein [Polyangiaceae bacterium]